MEFLSTGQLAMVRGKKLTLKCKDGPQSPDIRYIFYDAFYRYKLYFTNTKHYSYKFFDETGDSYSVNTYRAGDHFVRFDSDKPKIVYISGG